MTTTYTDADLRDAYDRAGLARIGIDFERAMRISYIRTGLINDIHARRQLAARQARAAAIPHQVREALDAAEAESIPRVDTTRFIANYTEAC